ncbi:MAG: OFA family MFS transporter [Desulfarculus sp.]|nr:OFA family MFS transporter [Pseudomonadota bacterium]MBV1718030.1 OFA family MFS transporter [Desulfarculus sp.]MBU4575549.1 OFA family MFS transporter [Pseudomonadota bacterium]MBU4597535.1 OFA family MFS transporter [Pseudomonadota bacterium]MBV1739269.1 OFA family MFS transporter [Desulfarculus sp.]
MQNSGYYRWVLMGAAVCVKMVISIYQYSWFLFAFTITRQEGWSLEQVGLTFTVLILAATLVQPFSGIYADAAGPRRPCLLAACLVGAGMLAASYATSPLELCLYYGMGGLGVGALNGISTATALKWFPRKRGLATGVVEFGFGAGTLFFNFFLQDSLELFGWRETFWYLSLAMAAVLLPLALLYTYPSEDWVRRLSPRRPQQPATAQYRPVQMVATHQWQIIYLGFTLIIATVLMFASHLKMIAQEFGISGTLFAFVMVAFPLGNGFSRIVGGVVSDYLGRERTMLLFFSLLGLCMLSLGLFGSQPWVFVGAVFLAGLLGGAPFVLYAAMVGDYFGASNATANWGLTITGKAWAGLIAGWFSGYLVSLSGTYQTPLLVLALCCFVAAALSNPRLLRIPGPPGRPVAPAPAGTNS